MVDKPDIVVLGGGGHARVLIELIRSVGKFNITGILDSQLKAGSIVSKSAVLGNDDLLSELYANGTKNASVGIGSIRDNSKRKELYEKVLQRGFHFPGLVHAKSIVIEDVEISGGVQIMAGAIVQTGNIIGENTIINTGSVIEHDCRIGKHVNISPGAIILGECIINDGAFIGAGATIIQGLNIGKHSIVAAGAVVVKDVPEGAKVIGVPAKEVKE